MAGTLIGYLASISRAAGANVSPRPGRVVDLAPGALVAWDDCCDGQVWSRLVSVTPAAASSPQRKHGLDVCATPHFIFTAELGIVRCAATINDRGQAPSPAQISKDGAQSLADMAALLATLRRAPGVRSVVQWTPQGPDGGCHGGFWTFTSTIENCLTCEPEEPDED